MAGDAFALHCPNCGAAADPAAGRCPYCQAKLATASCPACFALIFDGAAFCPRCGARRTRQEAEDADLRCPGCDGALRQVDIGDTRLLECAACDSVWIDADVFEALCQNRESQAAVLHRKGRAAAMTPRGPVKYRRCLRCSNVMNRVNFGRVSGTVVDVCRGHGTFLDAGELHQIVAFIQSGGLDRVRQIEIEQLKEEQQRLRMARWTSGRGEHTPVFDPDAATEAKALREMLRALLKG
jgi:Zn-finger nucleic acid-binding protein